MRAKKNKKKLNIKRVVLVLILIILIGYVLSMIIGCIRYTSKRYEYYTRDGKHGYSTECGVVVTGHESCLKGNMYIEVAQYSEVK